MPDTLAELHARIATRDADRSEATLQADIRQFLLTAPLSLREDDLSDVDLEAAVAGKRIDIEAGRCLVEVKRDLSAGRTLADAVDQLTGYLARRQEETACRYVGIVTDGAAWHCVCIADPEPDGEADAAAPPDDGPAARVVSVHHAKVGGVEALTVWVEGVLATARDVPATPEEIRRRLGAGSSAHDLDRATLLSLFRRHRDHPAVRMKRQLWSRLLTTAFGTQFRDSDELFVEHTYLVVTAEVIAHALVGFDLGDVPPLSLVSGSEFAERGIGGVVEADFFDWPAHVEGGGPFVRALALRIARFRWDRVGGDVLKVLYESVINAETRKRLGEYYTPDWLAEHVVAETVPDPLSERVLDPACGSGTFLFHAVRRYLDAADAEGVPLSEALPGLTRHVLGMDLHPVAVTLARVTYLLAIGQERLRDGSRGRVQVPVYLGDAVQWQREARDLFTDGHLIIAVEDDRELFASDLRFPDHLLEDPARFNELVGVLTDRAARREPGSAVPPLTAVFQQFGIPEDSRGPLAATFKTLCELHDQGRDHIWGYYVRNLARPWWLAMPANRVDVLVGNPPWLAYRFMSESMQQTFREYSEERGLWHGAKVATHQDLSGLFLVRTAERYLREGGRFAYVMPAAVLERAQYKGLRSGRYRTEAAEPLTVAFDRASDLRRIRPHIFPISSCVVSGTRGGDPPPLSEDVLQWTGRRPDPKAGWAEAEPRLTREEGTVRQNNGDDPTSPWHDRFRNGATIVPRMLHLVERRDPGPLGMPMGRVRVRSLQRNNDKKPWKSLPPLEHVVETQFVRPTLLGESVLPYRIGNTFESVIPRDADGLMDGTSDRLDCYDGLARWWRHAEEVWEANRSSGRYTLLERLNFHGELEQQFPTQPRRIAYNTSGMHLCAVRVNDDRALIDNSLYWATADSDEEARYLIAVLNAAEFTRLVTPLMSYGKDPRHFHKHIFQLPIPAYDAGSDLHRRLAGRAAELEALVAAHPVDPDRHFPATRRDLRELIADSEAGRDVEDLVVELLG